VCAKPLPHISTNVNLYYCPSWTFNGGEEEKGKGFLTCYSSVSHKLHPHPHQNPAPNLVYLRSPTSFFHRVAGRYCGRGDVHMLPPRIVLGLPGLMQGVVDGKFSATGRADEGEEVRDGVCGG
jgi:hypothetical protein